MRTYLIFGRHEVSEVTQWRRGKDNREKNTLINIFTGEEIFGVFLIVTSLIPSFSLLHYCRDTA